MLTDTHAHLYWDSFKSDFDEVVQKCLEASVSTIINVGVDVDLSAKALKQVENELANISGLQVYSTIGLHPHEAVKYSENPDVSIQKDIDGLEDIYRSNPKKVVGVGECGLDFLFNSNDFHPSNTLSPDQTKNLQRKLFLAQINLAKKLDLPLSIHVRDDRSKNPENSECWDKAIELASSHYGVFHCYSGLPNTTDKILDTKFYISFAANITYPKNEYLQEAAKKIPLNRIVLETDCPFLSPQSSRGKRNDPSSVLGIATLVAELKGVSLEEVVKQTSQNAADLFKINT